MEQAKVIVANEQIVQAKKDYAVAEKKEDKAAMNVAKETANKARQSGGTISSDVTLEYALKILDQSKWNAIDHSSPMDAISTEDEASLMNKARENASTFGMDEQIAKLNKSIVDLTTAILTLETSNMSVKETIESLKQQKEELQEDQKRLLELGKWIDTLQEDIHSELESTNKVITELSKLLEKGKLSSERVLKLVESIHVASDEQRGTVLGEAMSGFFSGLWSSLEDTVDLVFYAFEDPQAAGKQTINGVGDMLQSLWDKLSDPKATYNDAEQSIKEFMELSDEEQAYAVGFLLSQLSPSRRVDILNPMKNKDDGASGLEGNNSNSEVKGSNGVEGTGDGGKIISSVDDLSDVTKSKITTSQRTTLNQQERTYSHLTEMDLKGAQRDLDGDPVPKPGGGYYDHAQEVSDAYRGLVDLKRSWEGMLKNPNLDNELRQFYTSKLNEVNATMKKIEDMFAPHGGVYPPK